MMQCPRCRHENRPRAKFCEECGAPLALTCPSCGTELSPSAKFCSECGHLVSGPAAAPPRFVSPQTYTPGHLAEKILISTGASSPLTGTAPRAATSTCPSASRSVSAVRRTLHGAVLAAIERRAETRGAEEAEARAYHAVRAEAWEQAVDALREAGTAAFGRGAITASIERIEQAIELLPRLPGSADNTRRGIDVRLSCVPLLARGQHSRFGALVREAAQLARDLDDQRRLAQALRLLGGALMAEGQYVRAAEHEEEVLGLSTTLADAEVRVAAAFTLGQILGALGRYREGIARLVPIADGPDAEVATSLLGASTQAYAAACAWLGWFHAALGKFEEGRRYADRGVESAQRVSHPPTQVFVGNVRAYIDAYQGRFDRAIPVLERALREAEVHGLAMINTLSSVLGGALAGTGRTAEGLALLARGVGGQERSGNRFHLARRYREWADSLLLAGELPEAQRAADTALSLARAMGERGAEAETLRVLGAIAAAGRPGDPEAAATLYRQGLALAGELGMRPSAAHCHLGLGGLYRRAGDRANAKEHLTTSATMYREMDMGFWLAKAEAELQSRPSYASDTRTVRSFQASSSACRLS